MKPKIDIREIRTAVILDMRGRVVLGEGLTDLRDSIRETLAGDQKNITARTSLRSATSIVGAGPADRQLCNRCHQGGQMKLLNLQKRVNDLLQITEASDRF